ncbi:helix-turn-helix domain-containing protein [Halosimplex halophilum]|uniref:helix-turn-helix domain-containing protein n=1 Tax=Halosimplex halophilum TaxID=2559572 RepID=UPI00107F623A|nr:helix-turn-helix domain-containing protein [Halosimplex halophilum]
MKRTRITIHPEESELPQTFDDVTEADDQPVQVEVINWNVTTTPVAFLLRLSGDVDRFETALENDDAITEYELLRESERESYCFVSGIGTSDARALWENFKRGSLMTVPPATWNADGSYTFTLVGRESDIQTAIERVPPTVRVEIESVGGTQVSAEQIRHRLTERQRTAVQAGLELGYYSTPREATTEDIADVLDCGVSTAAEHLRKAESKLVQGLFRD